MAEQVGNYEQFGVKEVADVTFFRIEKAEETYESQRTINISSVLKGAVEQKTVYPLEEGSGAEDGFEAYVFTDAELLTGANYVCDDNVEIEKSVSFLNFDFEVTATTAQELVDAGAINKQLTALGLVVSDITVNETKSSFNLVTGETKVYNGTIVFTYVDDGAVGSTHEYSYEEQVLLLFAKNQNLIHKSGVRFRFTEPDLFGNFTFSDEFAAAPNSTEKVVVLVYAGKDTDTTYDTEEVRAEIDKLTTSYKAKAYDVTYKDYAELFVKDEMGYYNPDFLGTAYVKNNDGSYSITTGYPGEFENPDAVLTGAKMWGSSTHLSINDAIDALKEKKKILDTKTESGLSGLNSISGGYKVSEIEEANGTDADGIYNYSPVGDPSDYTLKDVLEKITALSTLDEAVGADLVVTDNGTISNRAIYVRVDGMVDTSASAYIYILKNKDYKKLSADKSGLFTFKDRNGNSCVYKDTIFAGEEYLALVVIGDKGLIFTVGRCGTRKIEKVAWMVNESGYASVSQCKTLVNNGLLHTVDVTVNDETFEATCSVSGLKIRKIKKQVLRYVPVLYLDSLKVSTIEQTAEQAAATGGQGNAQLIIWDYNKEITLTLEDALYTPASMSAMMGSYKGKDFVSGIKDTKKIDRMEKCKATRSFIIPAGNSNGVPSEGNNSVEAVYIDPATMQPYQDGTPIAIDEMYLKWTRSLAYGDNSLGKKIEISANAFPGTYKIVGETFARNRNTGEDQRFQFVINQAKMNSERTITLEAEGDPSVFDMSLTVLRPDDGVMMSMIQYDVEENVEQNDGSTMVKNTENLNILDDAEMFKVSADAEDDEIYIGATEY